jgi:hypothetical protein
MDISSALNVEKVTDNNALLHLPTYHPNRITGALAMPISNSKLEINYLDSTIYHKGQQNLFYSSDIESKENKLQTFISPSKLNKPENLCQKKNYIKNAFSNHVDQEHVNEDTRICRIYSLKENDRPTKNISDVFQIDKSTTDLFEDMFETQNQEYGLTHKTFVNLPLQHTTVQKSPLQDCHTGRGTELSNEEEQLLLSCDMFDSGGDSILDEAASDKLKNKGSQDAIIDAALSKVVTQDPNYYMPFKDSSSIMEDECYKGDELCEKYPSQNNCSRIQPFMAVTVTDKDQGSCVSVQNLNYNEDIGTGNIEMAIPEDENQKRSNKDIKAVADWFLHEAEFQSNSSTTLENIYHKSHKTIQLKSRASLEESTAKTSHHSHYKEALSPFGEQSSKAVCAKKKKHKNTFVNGRYYMSMKEKLEVPGVFQKRGNTKVKLCSNQQITYSEVNINGSETEVSAINTEDVTAGIFASGGRNKRKTTFQTPFKKISFQAKQVLKLTHFFFYISMFIVDALAVPTYDNSLCSCVNNFCLDSISVPIAMEGSHNREVLRC